MQTLIWLHSTQKFAPIYIQFSYGLLSKDNHKIRKYIGRCLCKYIDMWTTWNTKGWIWMFWWSTISHYWWNRTDRPSSKDSQLPLREHCRRRDFKSIWLTRCNVHPIKFESALKHFKTQPIIRLAGQILPSVSLSTLDILPALMLTEERSFNFNQLYSYLRVAEVNFKAYGCAKHLVINAGNVLREYHRQIKDWVAKFRRYYSI